MELDISMTFSTHSITGPICNKPPVSLFTADLGTTPNVRKRSIKEFRYHLSKDPIQATLVDVTGLQLVEVTRKKVRKPLYEYHTK